MAILQLSFANAIDMLHDHVICIFEGLFNRNTMASSIEYDRLYR